MTQHIILISCEDQSGLIHKITGVFYKLNLNIVANWEFVDPESKQFFMRIESEGTFEQKQLSQELINILPQDTHVKIFAKRQKNILILATKEPHCLGDLLVRCSYDGINANIQAVISNHNTLEFLVNKFDCPFHYVPSENKDRKEHESKISTIIKQYNPDYLVLAKYMRILTQAFVDQYPNRIINIHHSFLPAFIGASPYHQAYERGVKIVGASAHFVTENLDEGPIIAQGVINVNHTHSPEDMALAGHDVEKTILAKALRLVLEERVFVIGNKTIIFD